MSIYVSISCLGFDSELENTIQSCISTAEKPEDIFIGVSMVGKKDFYNEMVTKFNNENIKFKFDSFEDGVNVGKGRVLAASMYNDQDYFLQTDAHVMFTQGWDKYLIDRFLNGQKIVNNQKIVLTGTLPPYVRVSGIPTLRDESVLVTKYVPNVYMVNSRAIPGWVGMHTSELSEKVKKYIDETGFAPEPKITAMFIFGNKYFANELCIDESFIFWEEEPLQSLELINNGFTIMYPGPYPVLYHMYNSDSIDGEYYRDGLDEITKQLNFSKTSYYFKIENNYNSFIYNKDNKEKRKRYEDYIKFNMGIGTKNIGEYPDNYANIGFLPV